MVVGDTVCKYAREQRNEREGKRASGSAMEPAYIIARSRALCFGGIRYTLLSRVVRDGDERELPMLLSGWVACLDVSPQGATDVKKQGSQTFFMIPAV